jgi:hypothetical protein
LEYSVLGFSESCARANCRAVGLGLYQGRRGREDRNVTRIIDPRRTADFSEEVYIASRNTLLHAILSISGDVV